MSGNYANTNPTLRMPQTTSAFGTAGVTRSWTDANGNFVPDCDLLNPAAQDLPGGRRRSVRRAVEHELRPERADQQFRAGGSQRLGRASVGLESQRLACSSRFGARSSVDVAYTRRWYHGFFVADNLALQPSDLTPFSIVAPADARLPGGGGYVVSGLVRRGPGQSRAGRTTSSPTRRTYGAWSQYFNGVDVTANIRLGRALHARGRDEHRPDRRRQLRRPRPPARAGHDGNGHERVRRRTERLRGHAR